MKFNVLNKLQLTSSFHSAVSAELLKYGKPNPEVFLICADNLKINPANCIVIEDSDNGVKSANDAGIFVVGYKNPLVEDQTLENADIIVESFDELKDHI